MTTMAATRAELTSVLAEELGTGYEVVPFWIEKTPHKPLVLVGPDRIRRGPTNTIRIKQIGLVVVGVKTEPGRGDDALDGYVEAVLDVLDRIPGIVWSEAERGIYAESQPAYTITVTLED